MNWPINNNKLLKIGHIFDFPTFNLQPQGLLDLPWAVVNYLHIFIQAVKTFVG
jgi:hypothetical protein